MKYSAIAIICITLSSTVTALNSTSSQVRRKKSTKSKGSKSAKTPKWKTGALLEIELDVFGEVHPAKMDIGPDNRIYFTGGTDSRAYRVDKKGSAEMFAEITTGAGFTLGCQFDKKGNFFMVNGAGIYRVPARKLSNKKQPLPIEPDMFFPWTTGPAIPMSIDIDNNTGFAYVSDMGKGEIWKINTKSGDGAVWASSQDGSGAYDLLFGDPDSTNFLGVPFGVVEVMVDKKSEWLYFSAHERNFFGRIKMRDNGKAGRLQVLGEVPNRAALNGAFLDVRNIKLYGATPFLNFHNGIERKPKATRGGEIWMIDINDIDDKGEGGIPKLIVRDLKLGTLTDIITGHNFGNEADLYLLDGSFDTLEWPTGIVPDPDAPYHGAVRVLKSKHLKATTGENNGGDE